MTSIPQCAICAGKGVKFRGEPVQKDFGIVTTMLLTGGLEILLYQPSHESPLDL
jgi:hypothetical protein